MDIRPLKTERDYIEALRAIEALLARELPDGSEDLDRLDVLSTLVEKYEDQFYALALPDPIDAIWIRMEELGINQRKLAAEADIAESKISEVLSRKRPLSLGMIRALRRILGIPEAVLVQEYPLASAA